MLGSRIDMSTNSHCSNSVPFHETRIFAWSQQVPRFCFGLIYCTIDCRDRRWNGGSRVLWTCNYPTRVQQLTLHFPTAAEMANIEYSQQS